MAFERVEIGPATLVRGDAADVLSTLESGSVNVIVADPPYGARRPSAWRSAAERFAEVKGNDCVDGSWLSEASRLLVDSGACYVFVCWDRLGEWAALLSDNGLRPRSCIVWDKTVHGLADLKTCWAPMHEMILFAAKGRHELRGGRPKDILSVPKVLPQELVHPYQKPVALIRRLIAPSTSPGDVVLDPMMGSGTAVVAAIHAGRRAIGVELDPAHFDVARRRVSAAVADARSSLFPGPSVAPASPGLFPEE